MQDGMSYDQVVWLAGSRGVELSRSNVGGYTTIMYSWRNANGANMNALFQDDKLVTVSHGIIRYDPELIS